MISKQEAREWDSAPWMRPTEEAVAAQEFPVTDTDRVEADRLIAAQKAGGGLDARYYQTRTPEGALVPRRHPSSQKFHDLCDAMKAMHDKKQQDYGRANDPFANVRSTEGWGQPAWVGAMIRATDKLRRLQKAAAGGTMANESVEDSFIDLAVYTIIGLVLYQENKG